jgi:hypothetical protein
MQHLPAKRVSAQIGGDIMRNGLLPILSDREPTTGAITSFNMLCMLPITLIMKAVLAVSPLVTLSTSCPAGWLTIRRSIHMKPHAKMMGLAASAATFLLAAIAACVASFPSSTTSSSFAMTSYFLTIKKSYLRGGGPRRTEIFFGVRSRVRVVSLREGSPRQRAFANSSLPIDAALLSRLAINEPS